MEALVNGVRDLVECRPKLRGWLRAARGMNTPLLTWALCMLNRAADENDEWERKVAVLFERARASGADVYCVLHGCDMRACVAQHED